MEAFVDYPTGETKRVSARVACGARIRRVEDGRQFCLSQLYQHDRMRFTIGAKPVWVIEQYAGRGKKDEH